VPRFLAERARSESGSGRLTCRRVAFSRLCRFYEWPETGRSSKSPMYSKLKNGSLMAMAGLWDRPAAGQDTDTFAIVTVDSTPKLAPVSQSPCPDTCSSNGTDRCPY
jgi:hypothetical protein